jgi:monomeric sarcosine oxidase
MEQIISSMAKQSTFDVAVVGAGVFGAWSAYQIRRTGASVVLIDQYGAGNSRASSGGETRMIRLGYGADEIYSRSAQRSLPFWRDLSKQTGHSLFQRTGVLWLAHEGEAYPVDTLATLAKIGAVFQELTRSEVEQRYSQINFDDIAWAIFEPESGVLMARRAVRAVVKQAQADGVTYLHDSVLPPQGSGRLRSIALSSGEEISAREFVFACGPWLPRIFPEVLGELIHVTRQEVFFFGTPAGDSRFGPQQMPAWIDFTELVYALPDIDGRGFKIAIDAHGADFDPDNDARMSSKEGLSAVREHLKRRVPVLAEAPVLETRVCQYENTSNGDFLIDRHPAFENLWLVGGGSGHGFKHGPVVGEYVAGMISGKVKLELRFSLAEKDRVQRRQVY